MLTFYLHINNLLFNPIIINLFEINILLLYEPTAQHCIQMSTCVRDQQFKVNAVFCTHVLDLKKLSVVNVISIIFHGAN